MSGHRVTLPFLRRFATVKVLIFWRKMPKLEDHPMASKHDEITDVLQQAGEDDIEIIRRSDEMVIHIKFLPKQPPPAEKKGKWAKVAEEMAEENFLGDGRGDRLRKAIREFRDNFQFRDVFADSRKK
jgi:hypothetical protein